MLGWVILLLHMALTESLGALQGWLVWAEGSEMVSPTA